MRFLQSIRVLPLRFASDFLIIISSLYFPEFDNYLLMLVRSALHFTYPDFHFKNF